MKPHAVHYTIRGIPPEVDKALRKLAARKKQSLNQCVVEQLVSATVGQTVKADFSDLVGRWVEDPEFDDIIASQRRIDHEKWQ